MYIKWVKSPCVFLGNTFDLPVQKVLLKWRGRSQTGRQDGSFRSESLLFLLFSPSLPSLLSSSLPSRPPSCVHFLIKAQPMAGHRPALHGNGMSLWLGGIIVLEPGRTQWQTETVQLSPWWASSLNPLSIPWKDVVYSLPVWNDKGPTQSIIPTCAGESDRKKKIWRRRKEEWGRVRDGEKTEKMYLEALWVHLYLFDSICF